MTRFVGFSAFAVGTLFFVSRAAATTLAPGGLVENYNAGFFRIFANDLSYTPAQIQQNTSGAVSISTTVSKPAAAVSGSLAVSTTPTPSISITADLFADTGGFATARILASTRYSFEIFGADGTATVMVNALSGVGFNSLSPREYLGASLRSYFSRSAAPPKDCPDRADSPWLISTPSRPIRFITCTWTLILTPPLTAALPGSREMATKIYSPLSIRLSIWWVRTHFCMTLPSPRGLATV